MAYASSTTCLLTRLPHAGLYNYNGRQIELGLTGLIVDNGLFVDRLTGPWLMSL